jgi:cytochrome c biogenesis protein CcmG/thiol:disulfide interchange protein DsbE
MSSRSRAVRAQRKKEQHRNVAFTAIVGAMIVAAVVAIALTRGSSGSSGKPAIASQVAPVTVRGTALPSYDANAADAAVGATIPQLSGTALDGKPIALTNDGKAKVVLFVAHWCPHCRAEVPRLVSELQSHPLPAGVELFAVSTAVDPSAPNYPPSAWLSSAGFPARVMADDATQSAAKAYGLTGYPYFVFVDAQNRVVARASGEIAMTDFRVRVSELARS